MHDRTRRKAFAQRSTAILVALIIVLILRSTEQAAAEGLFGLLFGSAKQTDPPEVLSYAPPIPGLPLHAQPAVSGVSTADAGRSTAYCVRLCDGRFFPIQRSSAATPEQLCNAFCPASQTKIFTGSEIAYAVAADGTHYTQLQNAFIYRKKIAPHCTCDGKNNFGLAPIDLKVDPTLRAGDIVVTTNGKVTFLSTKRAALALR